VSLAGLGRYLPPKVLANSDLAKMVETSDEWIRTRTGISERRISGTDVASSDLAVPAAKQAMEQAGITADDLDMIIAATITPDMLCPSTACLIQAKLGAKRAGAFDLSAACTGFIYSLAVAHGLIATGSARNVLIVGTECLSRIVDWTDRNTCVLFGDGAGAAVVRPSNGRGELLDTFLAADGTGEELIFIPAGGSRLPANRETTDQRLHFLKIKGQEVFKFAVTAFKRLVQCSVERCGIREEDIHLVVPHQVNVRIIDSALKGLKIARERVYVNLDRYGNTSAASVPIALSEAVEMGRLKPGDIVLMVAFGGGLTWGSAVVRW
jgi:3-oxoacyl-[acyl-carrier-protein] synthase-3